jgi:hypothetical protein
MRGCVLAWALAALLAAAAPATGASVTASGSLLVRWQSNPDTCAEHGLCGRSGSLSWRPDREGGDAGFVDSDVAFVSMIGTDAIARSYRGDSGSCIDRSSAPVDIIGRPGPHSGQSVFSMRQSDAFSFGHCAGPVAADFIQALPESQPVSNAAVRSRGVIDLRGRTPFSGGPFSGEVVSTLVLRTRPDPPSDSSRSFSGSFTPKTTRGRRVHYGIVTASYAIEGLTGDTGYAFTGAPEAECSPFDTCGLAGELTLHAAVTAGSLTVSSRRPLAAGARETVSAGLRALRRGGTSVYAAAQVGPPEDYDGSEQSFAIPFSETATPAGGDPCSDSGSFREPNLRLRRARGGVLMQLKHGGNTDPDPLRTRCPGPGGDDVASLAGGVMPLESVGRQRLELTLRPNATFTMVGLRGTGRGALHLVLRLTSVRATTSTSRVRHEELF